MEITILVEPVTGNGFRAVSGEPFRFEADAPTRDEAVHKLEALIAHRLQSGTEVIQLKIRNSLHPLSQFAGMLKDDSLLEPWKDAIREYRQQHESGHNAP